MFFKFDTIFSINSVFKFIFFTNELNFLSLCEKISEDKLVVKIYMKEFNIKITN